MAFENLRTNTFGGFLGINIIYRLRKTYIYLIFIELKSMIFSKYLTKNQYYYPHEIDELLI